jgi:hypothetical protein
VLINPARNPSIFRRRFPIRLWYPSQHLLRQNPLPRSQFGSRRRFPRAASQRQTVVRPACRGQRRRGPGHPPLAARAQQSDKTVRVGFFGNSLNSPPSIAYYQAFLFCAIRSAALNWSAVSASQRTASRFFSGKACVSTTLNLDVRAQKLENPPYDFDAAFRNCGRCGRRWCWS